MKAAFKPLQNMREGAATKLIQKSEDLPELLMNICSA
jgi:hypothetical protein